MHMINGPKKTVFLGLPEECYDKIKSLADDTYRTVPSYIRMIIYNYLRRLESSDPKQDDRWIVR